MQQWEQFGCGNYLVLNWEDSGLGLCLCLGMMVQNKLACYTINDGLDGCHVCFTARKYTAGENGNMLDGAM